MSDEDVAFVRRGFQVVARAFDAYCAFAGKAKDGPPMTGGFFAIFTVRDGRILTVHEHTTRAEALAALEQA